MSSRMVFNPGPEVAGSRGAEGATAHYSWKLAGMFSGTNREGYAFGQALGTLGIDQLQVPRTNAEVFTGSTAQMIKFQRSLGIAAGKIAHDSASVEGDTGIRYIGEQLYNFAVNPGSFIDKDSGDPLPFHRAIGKIALPFADMIEEDMVYHYYDMRPEQVDLAPPLRATPEHKTWGYRKPTDPVELRLPRQDIQLATALALVDDTNLADQIRHALRLYIDRRLDDPETNKAANDAIRSQGDNDAVIL